MKKPFNSAILKGCFWCFKNTGYSFSNNKKGISMFKFTRKIEKPDGYKEETQLTIKSSFIKRIFQFFGISG